MRAYHLLVRVTLGYFLDVWFVLFLLFYISLVGLHILKKCMTYCTDVVSEDKVHGDPSIPCIVV